MGFGTHHDNRLKLAFDFPGFPTDEELAYI